MSIDLTMRKLPHGTRGANHDPRKIWVRQAMQGQAFVDDFNQFGFDDDFGVDTLKGGFWASAVEADETDQSTIVIVEAPYGTVALSLGSTANDFANLASPIQFSTSAPGRMDIRLKVTTGANALDNLVVGLTDAKTESDGNLCTNVTTPAIVPDDFMGFIYELANGGDLWYYGTANNTVDTARATTLTIGTSYQKLSIKWNSDLSVDFAINDVWLGTLTSAYRTGVTLCAIIAATHVGGTGDPVLTVDRIRVVQERV